MFYNFLKSTYAIGATPIGAPGCPELALLTWSIDKNLNVFIVFETISILLKVGI